MPSGIASHLKFFRKEINSFWRYIESVEVYFDDIIERCDKAIYDIVTSKVLDRARSLNTKFNPDKQQHEAPEVKYIDHIISKSSIKADPHHIKAHDDIPISKS